MRNPQDKILSLEQALNWRCELRKRQLSMVVTNGCFDILHRGHCGFLHQASRFGDVLLVLLNSDESVRALKGKARPINPAADRAYVLASLRAVDGVVIFDGERCDGELRALAPDTYTKGCDYGLDNLDAGERAALEEHKSEILFIPLVEGYSTTAIIDKQ